MAKMESVSKMVTRGVKKTSDVAQNTVTGVAKTSTKGVSKVLKKVQGFCKPESVIPCITMVTLIAYIVIVSPATVLDLFSTQWGKALSMFLVFVALLFDLKLGVMLGLAVILSISLASVNKDLYESFDAHTDADESNMIDTAVSNIMGNDEDASGLEDASGDEFSSEPEDVMVDNFTNPLPSESDDLPGLDKTMCKYAPVVSQDS